MLLSPVKVLFILLLLQLQNTKADWLEPYFSDTQTLGVILQNAVGVQKINVEEELAWPFKLAKVNYDGAGTPSMGSFDIGDNSLLGAKISRNGSDWLITIEKRQDYENPQQRIYSFQIYIKDDDANALMEQSILLTLENVFDNKPSVTYNPSPCRVEELHSNYLTNCIFSVYDPDGMDRNNIRIDASGGQFNEVGIFGFTKFGNTTTYSQSFQLSINQELHYEERAIYNLEVRVHDRSNNTGDIFAILEVIDLPNRDPIWVRPLTTATFDEKQEQYFQLKAIDGDTGIDKPICYRLEFEEDYSQLMHINASSGLLYVSPIDRDALDQQIFTFYTCAYKCDNTSWAIKNTTILIVQDINDHMPEITLVPSVVQILEAKYLTLPLETFLIEDIDLGNNATFSVFFSSPTGSLVYSDALSLIPNSGYQKTNFSLTVTQAESLDYENENWRSFEIVIIAQEVENLRHISNHTLRIELINWNDEWPIFSKQNYEARVMENVTRETFLEQVFATDRDFGDEVIHAIVGNMPGLQINSSSGILTTTTDNVFDYERQSLVMLQIQAQDTLVTDYSQVLHTSFAQLSIHVMDVNDEMPELRMPRSIVNLTENCEAFTIVTDKIEAHDPDSTANLSFDILWSYSYATKSGQEALSGVFVGCFIIDLLSESENVVYGLLRVNPDFEYQIDYEKYDTIFLTIKVTDLNQGINEDSSTAVLTIRIDDLNDNPPEFSVSTLPEPRKVTELEEESTVIGSIEAFDIDGPGNNVITFALRPIHNLTQEGLVIINNASGVMRVNGNIECDLPKIYFLEYEIILTDSVHTTVGKFNISIMDINNRVPELYSFEQQVSIYENASTGDLVGQIKAHDDDRDMPHNVLEYLINSAIGQTQNLFQINTTNGRITVNLRHDLSLDRDNGVTFHYIPVEIKDNFNYNNPGYGAVNQRSTFLNVTLLDVNDNAPIMPLPSVFSPEFSEADLNNSFSKAELIAEDKDEPNTPNSWVSYRILDIEPVQDNALNVSHYADLFDIVGNDKLFGKLVTRKDLKGFYGWWQIEIEAYDHGEPVMRNSSFYRAYIRPFNFHRPVIVFPRPNKSLRVCYALQEANRPLYQADCVSRLPLFEALDPDGGEYGDISFQLSSDTGHDKYFRILKENRNQSNFYLQQSVPAGIYQLNIRATDGGGSSSDDIRNLKIVFVDMLGNPMFLGNTFETDFTENGEGLLEERFLPSAYDPKNEGLDAHDEQYKLYYFIDDSVYPDDSKLFQLNSETRSLKLIEMLDREAIDTHHLRVKVTNNENGIITNPNSINYTLEVLIKVNDLNDNPPHFSQSLYAAGITPKDSMGKDILVFHADDPDLNDPTTYQIDFSTFEVHGENIGPQSNSFFLLNNQTGALSLNAYVTNNMKGYFMFSVESLDTAVPSHLDTAKVKIYIVSEVNRVKFVFLSNMESIRDNEKFIREEFQEIYDYEICNIDSVDDVTNQQKQNRLDDNVVNDSAAGLSFITDVTVHFIHNNEAVDSAEIQRRSSDLAFVSKLQNVLQRRNLILNDVPHLTLDSVTQTFEDWILTTLIVLCIVLAVLCAILVAVFLLKIHSLKRQLKAFEPPEFGSIASNLNRLGAGGLSTNIFSVEGSNPVLNNQNRQMPNRGVYEAESSSDSGEEEDEFEGLQDDPMFAMNNMKNYEMEKPLNTFEHKILNSNFFAKEKTTNEDTSQQLRY